MSTQLKYQSLNRVHLAKIFGNQKTVPCHPVISNLANKSFAPQLDFEPMTHLYGSHSVRPLVELPKSGHLAKDQRQYERDMTFKDFVQLVATNPIKPCYLAYLRPEDLDPVLAKQIDFSFLNLADPENTDTRLWLGSKGTNSGFHSDLKDNIFLQITGHKTIYLAPPSDTKFLYPFKDNIVNSQVEFPNPDLRRFPKLRNANIFRNHIAPGDCVFIPKGWWHCLIAKEKSISINHWFGPPAEAKFYFQLIKEQGLIYILRTILEAIKFGIFRLKPKNNFFFTPPPNGLRLIDYFLTGNFSKQNDPTI